MLRTFAKLFLGYLTDFTLLTVSHATLNPHVLSALAASKSSEGEQIIIYPRSTLHSLGSHASTLPIPARLIDDSMDNLDRELPLIPNWSPGDTLTFESTRRLVFVPWYMDLTLVAKEKLQSAARHPQVELFIYSNSPEEILKDFALSLCQVTLITDAGLNAPVNRYRNCEIRDLLFASQIFTRANSERAYVQIHGGMTFAAPPNPINGNVPEGIAIMDAYRTKNISAKLINVFDGRLFILNKTADVTLLGFPALANYERQFFTDASYPPAELCIFSLPTITLRVHFLESWFSFILFLLVLLSFGLAVYFLTKIRTKLLFHHFIFRGAGLILFMIAAFLGRSPPASIGEAVPYRTAAIVSWTLGASILGSYFQTTLIAIRSVPVASSGVPDVASLRKLVEQRKVELCITGYWRGVDTVDSLTLPENLFIVEAIARYKKREFPFRWPSECYGISRSGTHIALSLCTEDEVSVAKRSNLAPGQSCGLVNRMALVLKTNPERYFHARIIRTLSEAGLVTPHRRHLHRNTEDEDVEEDSDQSSVRLFFFVYLAGSALSLATLACELFWHKRKKTHGVYVRRAGARNYAVAPRRIMLRQWRLRTP
ncbi:hypothetical protein MRX96_001831 [Rhipicephalus microplus]